VRARAALLALLLVPGIAAASEPWIAAGDVRFRHDLQLLVDAGVLNVPMSAWPIAASDVSAAVQRVKEPETLEASLSAAYHRVKRRVSTEGAALEMEARGALRPTSLRTFADEPREEGEFSVAAAGYLGKRFAARLELTAVADPLDDEVLRPDGSYVAGIFGNWIVTAGAVDRWWGSGWDGSLLLSNSARPVPALSIDRAVSEPFESKWLSWIGPWRLTTFMGYMEGDRDDYDHPLLFGFRASARPWRGLEISLERTAQFCGDGRSCDWEDFWNLWIGNDNAGENVVAEDEPGNQLAGWDIRWASPVFDWPYAIYWQHTGESIDNKIPRPYRSMELAGLEVWNELETGGSWRARFEWANTRCGGTEDERKLWDCAYNSNIFDVEGYRSKDRALGHAMDGDGDMYSLGLVYVPQDGSTWSVLARHSRLNQGRDEPDTRHSVVPGREIWWSLDLTWRRELGAGWAEFGVGGDYRGQNGDSPHGDCPRGDCPQTLPRVQATWHHRF
jgi:hypothetical protein